MNNGHPSDEDIQLFVVDPAANAAGSQHIMSCEVCQAKVAAYRLLFTALAELPEEHFAFNLEDRVIRQILEPVAVPEPMPVPSRTGHHMPYAIWWVLVAFIAVAGPVAFFVRYRGLLAGMVSAAGPVVIPLGVTAALTCMAVLVTDMLRQYRRKIAILENSPQPATS